MFALVAFGMVSKAYGQDADREMSIELALDALTIESGDFEPRWSGRERQEMAIRLRNELDRLGFRTELRAYQESNDPALLDLFLPPVKGVNVVGYLPATTDTDISVVLGAHYDTVHGSPGANDNGSGLALALSVARRVKALPERAYDLEIVFFDQEEGGSFGSKAYASDLVKSSRPIHSVHTLDLVGWDGDGDGLMELDTDDPAIYDLYEQAALDAGLNLRRVSFGSSDHLSFRAAGYSASCLSEAVTSGDLSPHYHKETDRIEHLDLGYLSRGADMVFAVIRAIMEP